MSNTFFLSVTRHTTTRYTHSQKTLVNHFRKRLERLCYSQSSESLKSLTVHSSFINLLSPMTWPPKYFMVTLLTVVWGVHRHTRMCRKTHSPPKAVPFAMGLQIMKTNCQSDLKLYARWGSVLCSNNIYKAHGLCRPGCLALLPTTLMYILHGWMRDVTRQPRSLIYSIW